MHGYIHACTHTTHTQPFAPSRPGRREAQRPGSQGPQPPPLQEFGLAGRPRGHDPSLGLHLAVEGHKSFFGAAATARNSALARSRHFARPANHVTLVRRRGPARFLLVRLSSPASSFATLKGRASHLWMLPDIDTALGLFIP